MSKSLHWMRLCTSQSWWRHLTVLPGMVEIPSHMNFGDFADGFLMFVIGFATDPID